ncbi:MAG: glutathione S-transferase family protein, partial [Candidatus Binataceae bacterium]
QAIEIAKTNKPASPAASDASDPNGVKPGARVAVTPDDYAFDAVAGTVVLSTIHEIAIEREDPAVGRVVNHFPKIGFRISAA